MEEEKPTNVRNDASKTSQGSHTKLREDASLPDNDHDGETRVRTVHGYIGLDTVCVACIGRLLLSKESLLGYLFPGHVT